MEKQFRLAVEFEIEGEGFIRSCQEDRWTKGDHPETLDLVSLENSNGKRVGSFVDFGNVETKSKKILCDLVFDGLPPKGTKWLHATGVFPLGWASDDMTTPGILLNVREGELGKVGFFEIKVTDVVEHDQPKRRDSYRHELILEVTAREEHYEAIGCEFTHVDGSPLKYEGRRNGGWSRDGKKHSRYRYTFEEMPEQVHMNLIYHYCRDIVVPLDVKWDYPSQKQSNTGN